MKKLIITISIIYGLTILGFAALYILKPAWPDVHNDKLPLVENTKWGDTIE